MTDPIVARVVGKLQSRSEAGQRKYGTTLDAATGDFLRHLQEELMDSALYVEKLMAPGECAAQSEEWEARGRVLDSIVHTLHHMGGYDTLPDAVRKVVRERNDLKSEYARVCAMLQTIVAGMERNT